MQVIGQNNDGLDVKWLALAARQTSAASKGSNPMPINIAAQISTGAPMPEVPSMNAENANAIK